MTEYIRTQSSSFSGVSKTFFLFYFTSFPYYLPTLYLPSPMCVLLKNKNKFTTKSKCELEKNNNFIWHSITYTIVSDKNKGYCHSRINSNKLQSRTKKSFHVISNFY